MTQSPGTPPRARLGLRKRVAFSSAIIIGTLVLLELGAFAFYSIVRGRTFSWRALQAERSEILRKESGTRWVVGRVHPYVGFVQEPGDESSLVPFGQSQPIPISSYGYFDTAPPLHRRAPGKVVVAIVGGSVACQFAANGTGRLKAALAQDPDFAGKKFVFVNLAMGGYKQPQQLMTLSYLLALGAEFDIVLNIDGFNEVALYELENATTPVFPAFPRNWRARIEIAEPNQARFLGRLEYLYDERAALARRFSALPWRASILGNVIWDVLDHRARSEIFRVQLEATRTHSSGAGRYFVTGPPLRFASTEDLYRHLAGLWKHGSLQLDRLCRANGIRYYHFLQPNQYWRDSKPMGPEERRRAFFDRHPYRRGVERGYPLLIEEGRDLAARGVRFHDLTRIFADHPESIYHDDCCHYNRRGNELMAEQIAGAIRDDRATGVGR